MTRTRGRKRALSDEEKALWQQAISKTDPLRQEVPDFVEIIKPAQRRIQPDRSRITPFKLGEASQKKIPENRLQPSLDETFAKVSPNMDRRNFDRLRKGKKPVDGVLDLHGLTLAEAHPRLISFVRDAHVSEKRLLLIITGKGKTGEDQGFMPVRRGILRHQVPQWLQMPPLAPLVLQVTQAHGKHGGSGAYYIYLRRQR
ncbi:MAG: Smr/MutS family protein [Rhodobacteraceae bacterium]|nr:Smr/MutS family protein [Paracoccaceae bacterium]